MKIIIGLLVVIISTLGLSSCKNKNIIDNEKNIESIYFDNSFGKDYRYDLTKTDEVIKQIDVKTLTNWIAFIPGLTIIPYNDVAGYISAKFVEEIDVDLEKIIDASSVAPYKHNYYFTKDEIGQLVSDLDSDSNFNANLISVGLNVYYRVYELNCFKQKFKFFSQGEYELFLNTKILVPEYYYPALNYMNGSDEKLEYTKKI